jgi:L-seryl-tRNA(Ser) seleniumtransferase
MSQSARKLPPLHSVLDRRAVRSLLRRLRRDVVLGLGREALDAERSFLLKGKGFTGRYGAAAPSRDQILRVVEARLVESAEQLLRPRQRTVLNATGVLLHTNLGRAVLSDQAAAELARVASSPVAVEVDLATGRRDSRHARIERWLQLLTGAEAGLAVNNGAAALWLAVEALGRRRRVVISRGELVAIGGSFRMPELLRSTAAKIVEVGTTNKTSAKDYDREVREGDVVLKVHPSNYRIEGFTESAPLRDLGEICDRKGASLVFDAGSGSLYNFAKFRLSGEETVRASLKAGAHVVTFSGDKLLGGPQAGLLVGDRARISRMAKHPLQRALRCDKLTLGALEATLIAYAATEGVPSLPLFDRLGESVASLRKRGRKICEQLEPQLGPGASCVVRAARTAIGGGSFAGEDVASVELALKVDGERAAKRLHGQLRSGDPAILARIDGESLCFDLRTLGQANDGVLMQKLIELCRGDGGSV